MDDKTFNEIAQLLRKGMTIKDIAAELELPVSLIIKVAKKISKERE